jgi:hypothetical protein
LFLGFPPTRAKDLPRWMSCATRVDRGLRGAPPNQGDVSQIARITVTVHICCA